MNNSDILLHPELLPTETLLSILFERQIKIPNMFTLPRESILEIFHQYCVPYAQRKYRESGRGKILNKKRWPMDESPSKQSQMVTEQMLSNLRIHNHNERLRPPPEVYENKKIRLSNTNYDNKMNTFSNDLINGSKRKINCEYSLSSPSNEKKKRTPITWP